MNALDLNFKVTKFSMEEWPIDDNGQSVLKSMSPDVIKALFELRESVPDDCLMIPSPLVRAHIRSEPTGSRHSLKGGSRLSDATDFYVPRRYANIAWIQAMMHPQIGGVGIYQHSFLNGNYDGYTMLHIDTRPRSEARCWVASRNSPNNSFKYISIIHPEEMFSAMAKEGIFG